MSGIATRIRAIPSWQITLGIALLALGFLIAAQLSAEGPRIRYTTQERSPLVETALALQRQQDDLKERIVELRAQIQSLEQQGRGSAALVRELNDALDVARMSAGLIPLIGPGLVLQLEDSQAPVGEGGDADHLVAARDIRTVIDELWLAGAEALAVNGERVTTSTAVIDIGGTILVNSAYLAPPYQIAAIGPPDLFAILSESRGWAEFIEIRRGTFGIGVSFAELPDVAIPQFAGSVTLRESRAVPAPAATP